MTAPGDGTGPRVDVVVPARNEADLLLRCLEALATAERVLHRERPSVALGIVLVVDDGGEGHGDGTLAIATAAAREQRSLVVLEARLGAVGPARALGVRTALDLAPILPAAERWIANTDADSQVDPRWLVQQADALASGADVLVGAVVPDPDDLAPDVLDRWRRAHPAGATLGHVHGANLGIRADAYLALGGFAAVPEHEDVLLVERARDTGLVVEETEELPVTTSGRFVGRTPGGYAEHLRATYAEGPVAPVEPSRIA
ncbi:glycosyltransferase [Curtobacterium sp. Leaf261]|uniref:glycosyltransferase n=1 Tax=Curtobacterium sp. Leaf261 TaxID=1736311 RepID=UPI0006F32DC0|nr:glycosyltransferase [Curtobacterium sp. Leaf261]KQO62288.1 hypothetical protein ASF23_10805 [Curtobacterium sp. Leaf261]